MNGCILDEITDKLPFCVSRALSFLSSCDKEKICEIRLRTDKPVILSLAQKSLYLYCSGGMGEVENGELIFLSEGEINGCFLSLCNRSVYAHFEEIKEGYLSAGNGIRVGIAGRFCDDKSVRVFSLNIRIPHEVKNCSLPIIDYADKGLLIAGPPSSGKTTVLRDIAFKLSQNISGKRVCIIDSREEIASGFITGINTDVIINKNKAAGIETALRVMSPQIIIFDEIGNLYELEGVKNSLNAGVNIITTAHAKTLKELRERNVIKELLNIGAIEYIALLSGNFEKAPQIFKTEDIINDFY